MSQQVINVGSGELAGDGESLRSALTKVNANFTELYTTGGPSGPQGPSGSPGASGPQGPTGPNNFTSIGSHVLPASNLTYDLGSTSSQWRSLYIGTSTIYLGGTALSVVGGNLTVGGAPVSGGAANLGNFKISGNNLGTIDNPNTGGWGGYDMYIDPGNGSDAFIYIPGVPNQAASTNLQISNNSTAGAIQLFGRGGVQVVTNHDVNEKVFEFADNGSLIFPNSTVQSSAWTGSTSTLVNGTYTVSLSTAGNISFPDGNQITTTNDDFGIIAGSGNTLFLRNGSKDWVFNSNGTINLPNDSLINTPTTGNLIFTAANVDTPNSYGGSIRLNTGQGDDGYGSVIIDTGNYEFTFGSNGKLVLNPVGHFIDASVPELFTIQSATTSSQSQFDFYSYGAMGVPGVIYNKDTSNVGQLLLQGDVGESATYLALPSDVGSTTYNVRLANQNGDIQLYAGNSNWRFHNAGRIVFPNGTTSTGSTVYVPYATSSSFTVNTQIGQGPYTGQYRSFEVFPDKIKLPSGNGYIQSGDIADLWRLDSGNKYLEFPNISRIHYGDGNYLSTGTLQVDVRDGGIFQIRLNDDNKTWTFNNSGGIQFPDGVELGSNRLEVPPDESFTITTSYSVLGSPPAGPTVFNWQFSPNGYLTVPDGGIIETTLDDDLTISVNATVMSSPPGPMAIPYIFRGSGKLEFPDLSGAGISNPGGNGLVLVSNTWTWSFNYGGNIQFPDNTNQSTAWTKAAASVQSTPPSSPVTGQLYYDTDDGRTYIYTGSAWIDSNPAAGAGVTSITAGTGTEISTSTGAITIWNTGGVGTVLEETFETKNTVTGVTVHDCTTNRLFYLTNVSGNFTPNLTNLNLASGEATSVSIVVVQTSTARSISGVQIAGTTTGVTLTWQGSITAPSGNASRTEVFSFSILCTGTNAYVVLGMMTSFGGA